MAASLRRSYSGYSVDTDAAQALAPEAKVVDICCPRPSQGQAAHDGQPVKYTFHYTDTDQTGPANQ